MKKTGVAVSVALLISGAAYAGDDVFSDRLSETEEAKILLDDEIALAEEEMPGLQISYKDIKHIESSNMVHVDDVYVLIPSEPTHEEKSRKKVPIFIDKLAYTFGPVVETVEDIPEESRASVSGMSINLSQIKEDIQSTDEKIMLAIFAGDDDIIRLDSSVVQTMDKETMRMGITAHADVDGVGISDLSFSVAGFPDGSKQAAESIDAAIMQTQTIGISDLTWHGHSMAIKDTVARYAAVTNRGLDDVKETLRDEAIKMIKKEENDAALSPSDSVYADMVTSLYQSLEEDKEIHVSMSLSETLNFGKVMEVINAKDESEMMEILGLEIDFKAK